MVPSVIEDALVATGLPWSLEPGKKHIHIRLAGRLVGILPKGRKKGDFLSNRANLNIVSQVRHMAALLKEGSE